MNITILIEHQGIFGSTGGNTVQLEGMALNMTISFTASQALLVLKPGLIIINSGKAPLVALASRGLTIKHRVILRVMVTSMEHLII